MANESPRLKIGSFAAHVARGLVREQTMRRQAMFFVVLAAMLMLFFGLTFLQHTFAPHEHPFWFLLYWAACGWLTLTAILLAIFDLLVVRLRARTGRRELQKNLDEQ